MSPEIALRSSTVQEVTCRPAANESDENRMLCYRGDCGRDVLETVTTHANNPRALSCIPVSTGIGQLSPTATNRQRGSVNGAAYFAIYPMTGCVERQNVVQCNQQDNSGECGSLRKDRTEFVVPDINRSPKAALALASRTLVQE